MTMKIALPREDQVILKKVNICARRNKTVLFLVGGYIRDLILKRKKDNPDIDFCVENNALLFGRKLAFNQGWWPLYVFKR